MNPKTSVQSTSVFEETSRIDFMMGVVTVRGRGMGRNKEKFR